MAAATRFQIFVSSTQIDLRSEREKVINELNKVGFFAVGMEQFPATDEEQMDYIKPIIDESDYYIIIIKGRYGSTNSDGISYTELEYRYAVSINKPALAFIYRKRSELLISDTDDDSNKMEKLKNLVAELGSRRIVAYWDSADDLVSAVKDSVHALVRRKPGVGWVRGDLAIDPAVYKELETLRSENKNLIQRLNEDGGKVSFPTTIAHGSDQFKIGWQISKWAFSDDPGSQSIIDNYIDQIHEVKITWDEIIESLTESLYAEIEENGIITPLTDYVQRIVTISNSELANILASTQYYHIVLVGEPVIQIRFQLERLGIITTYTRSTSETMFDTVRTRTPLCWALTLKGRAYISELKALRRL
jgi:hypothetical protein